MKILAAGYSVRHIACSASRAGHQVIAADCFCDLDMERCAASCVKLEEDGAEDAVRDLVMKHSPDALVLGPGLEEVRIEGIRTLNNPPEKSSQVSDKLWLAGWLQARGFPSVPTSISSEGLSYPMVTKPRKGAGGAGIRLLEKPEDRMEAKEDIIDEIFQEFLKGIPASVSVVSTGNKARAIAVNEQIIGAAWAGAEGFRYSGNLTPLDPPCPELASMAEDIISRLGLVGSNGVDFLLTQRGPVVVEVNPRFQGSLDPVELSTGLNVFQAHLESFDGRLPEKPVPRLMAGRAVIYAEEDIVIREAFPWDWITDAPKVGSAIKKGDPLASVISIGRSRKEVLGLLRERASMLRGILG